MALNNHSLTPTLKIHLLLSNKMKSKILYCQLTFPKLNQENCTERGTLIPLTHIYMTTHRGYPGRDRMVVGFTTTCVISAYHH
jgi:hypothetical protein